MNNTNRAGSCGRMTTSGNAAKRNVSPDGFSHGRSDFIEKNKGIKKEYRNVCISVHFRSWDYLLFYADGRGNDSLSEGER